jgi:hypothetical protein
MQCWWKRCWGFCMQMPPDQRPLQLPDVPTYRQLIDLALAPNASFTLQLPSMMTAMYQMTM